MMIWNIGDNSSVALKLKPKSSLFYLVFTTPKTNSPKKLTLTVVEMQKLRDNEYADSKTDIFLPDEETIQR